METLKFNRRDDDKTISDLDFAKLFAVVQQSIFDLVEFQEGGFMLRTENGTEDDISILIERIANDIVEEIGLNNFVKFLFYQLFQQILETETEFLQIKGTDMQPFIEKYGKQDVGYAMSLSRSEDGLTEEQIRVLVFENTSLTWEQYQEIGTEVHTPPKTLMGGLSGLFDGEMSDELLEMLEGALGDDSTPKGNSPPDGSTGFFL